MKGVAELFAKLLGHKKTETFHWVKKVQTILIYHRGEGGILPPYSDLFIRNTGEEGLWGGGGERGLMLESMSMWLRLGLYSFCFKTEKKEPECDEMKLLYGMFLLTCLFVFVFHFELFGSFAWHEISIISGEFGYCPFHQLDFELILSNRLIENLFRVYIASSKQERGGNLQRCAFTS